ncbi:MAG: hypothetical protein JSW49_00185 [candidate division WOR-3 bacterium]|nr:MAG: hypothetical protein JSW49_00185 [candidate division WOR-3 bacterium]
MKNTESCDWLLQNGGPIVRYLTEKEMTRPCASSAGEMREELLQSSVVRYWMGCLTGRTTFSDIHGSRDTCFENVMGKLTLFGLRKGMGDLDRRCEPYLVWLKKVGEEEQDVLTVLCRSIVVSFLSAAGYSTEKEVRDLVIERIEQIHEFTGRRNYSIYVDRSKFKGIPRAYDNYPLVDPDLYPDGDFPLPWIYDIFAFRAIFHYSCGNRIRNMIEDIVSYILDLRYQQLHEGYGIVRTGNKRYHVMGWGVWLPGYGRLHTSAHKMACLVQRLALMSSFARVRSSKWFSENVNMLAGYENRPGRYSFPREYIREKRNSYYVTGAHMGLGEDRRLASALEIESTWWMRKILNDFDATEGVKNA